MRSESRKACGNWPPARLQNLSRGHFLWSDLWASWCLGCHCGRRDVGPGTVLETKSRPKGEIAMRKVSVFRCAVAPLAAGLLAGVMAAASAQTVRIGMTAADIPKTVGQPDQGFEGNRFTGNTMYEGLTAWDLSAADKASVVIPGVATEWAVSPADQTRWIFKLRPGVKFHDGSDFDADA